MPIRTWGIGSKKLINNKGRMPLIANWKAHIKEDLGMQGG
jgi:hypothetical protein